MEIHTNSGFYNFSAGETYIPSLVSFGACSGSQKSDDLVQKSRYYNNNMDLAG